MNANPVVRTVYGDVEGEWSEGVARFRGIVFADRIDGAGRFAAPRPPAPWSGVQKAQAWAPMTPQVADASVVNNGAYHRFLFGEFYDTPMSEDGLYLNLWTPSPKPGGKRPVMVWLHGGGFATGVATRAREEAALISARGDLVLVAPNHRLGAFGYCYLEDEARSPSTPNAGMLDIVAALEWVQANIEAFGGDPLNVTVFGESGGAMKVATLLSLPRAKGLFHRGICQAGVFAKGFRFAPIDRRAADANSRKLMRALGVGTFEALAAAPMALIIAAQETLDEGLMAWRPVVDGEILPADPGESVANGSKSDVPMIVGWAAHEADFIFQGTPRNAAEVQRILGPQGGRAFDAYSAAKPGASSGDISDAVLSDWVFGAPSIAFAEARARSGHRTYVYEMAYARREEPPARATHGAEAPFVFDRLESTGYSRNLDDAASLARTMQQAWIAFAHSGNPSTEIADWPPYRTPERKVMIFDRACHVASDPKRAEREFWRSELG